MVHAEPAGNASVLTKPLPYTGTASRARPSRLDSATPSSRAFRSHSAMSTAEMAIAAIPGRPALRTCRAMASAAPATSNASRPVTVPASNSSTTVAAAAAV